MKARLLFFTVSAAFLASMPSVYPQQKPESAQPYIDELKKNMEPVPNEEPPAASGDNEPYIRSLRKKMDQPKEDEEPSAPPESTGSYTEELRRSDPSLRKEQSPPGSYTQEERSKIGPGDTEGAIQAFKEGHSKLHPKYAKEPNSAFGFKIGTIMSRAIHATTSTRDFADVYGNAFRPDIQFTYEYQPWHNERIGSVGILAGLGVTYFQGFGIFQFQLYNAVTGKAFPKASLTKFQFFMVPIMTGANIRLNLSKYLRPYAYAGPALIPFAEVRFDDKSGYKGKSAAVVYGGGANIYLNWLFPKESWSLYETASVQKYYLTVDYSRISTFSGDVRFNVSGLSLGLTYEF